MQTFFSRVPDQPAHAHTHSSLPANPGGAYTHPRHARRHATRCPHPLHTAPLPAACPSLTSACLLLGTCFDTHLNSLTCRPTLPALPAAFFRCLLTPPPSVLPPAGVSVGSCLPLISHTHTPTSVPFIPFTSAHTPACFRSTAFGFQPPIGGLTCMAVAATPAASKNVVCGCWHGLSLRQPGLIPSSPEPHQNCKAAPAYLPAVAERQGQPLALPSCCNS